MLTLEISHETLAGCSTVRIGAGLLAIGHRPRLRDIPRLSKAGFTHVVSVLSGREDPKSIGLACGSAGLSHYCVPLGSTKSLPQRRKPEILEALSELTRVVSEGGGIYLHCSAGIHRTGMIAAALLFYSGAEAETVRQLLIHLRPITAAQMGEDRLAWAASFRPNSPVTRAKLLPNTHRIRHDDDR